jgi:lactoylglutathione lyase/glyoxylase I family protein
MIKTLAHVCLLSRDLEKTLDFYCGTLGLRRKFDFLRNDKLIGFYLEVGPQNFIEVFADKSDPIANPQGARIMHFCLEVEDIDALRERLIAKGIEVTEKKKGCDESWQIWCKDPDGTSIEFHMYTPESSQITGANCIVTW